MEVGPADRVLRDLRRPAALHRARAVRRRSCPPGGATTTDDQGPLHAGPAQRLPRPAMTPDVVREAERGWNPTAGLGGRWCSGHRSGRSINRVRGGAAAAPGVPHHADGLAHPTAVAGRRHRPGDREDAEDKGNLFAAIDTLRIPVEYLAELFTAGDDRPVDAVLRKLAAMRSYMRDINIGRDPPTSSIAAAVGMSEEEIYDMYRLLAIAKYDERYVIPPAHAEQAHSLEELPPSAASTTRAGRAWAARDRPARGRAAEPDRGRELPD